MPTTYTHYRFGKDVLSCLSLPLRNSINEYRELFDIGLHGPDIFFYYRAMHKNKVNQIGYRMHEEPASKFFLHGKEILENAINNYTGTVFYVSHDRYFINQTASRILELTNTKIINYLGNYDYYEEKCEELTKTYAPAIEKEKKVTSASSGKQDYLERKAEAARTRKLKNDISKVEKEIKEKEDRLNELDELLADPAVSTNSAKLNEISKEQNEISERLDELMDQWEILSDQLD